MKNKKIISIYRVSAYLLLLGLIHCVMTPVFYKSLTLDALWFFGTGLSMVFACLLNIVASRLLVPWVITLAIICNIIGTVFSVFILILLKQPQAFIGLLFFIIVLISGILARIQLNKE
jgi:hypothetical protein